MCLYILYEVQKVRELGWTYFHDSWVYFEIVNYLLFIGAFIMRFRPFYHVYTYGFPPRPDEFINYEPAMWAIIQVNTVTRTEQKFMSQQLSSIGKCLF